MRTDMTGPELLAPIARELAWHERPAQVDRHDVHTAVEWLCGRYTILKRSDRVDFLFYIGTGMCGRHATLELAQAAANADHLARIAAALDLDRLVAMVGEAQVAMMKALGWELSKVSMYDEEGVEGWRWTDPAGVDHDVMGDWQEPPVLPDDIREAFDKAMVGERG